MLNLNNSRNLPIFVSNIGVYGEATSSGLTKAAVYGWSYDDSTDNYGGLFVADGAGTNNYAVYALAENGTNNYARLL